MTLKALLKKRPVIYEIVPPRKDTSRYQTELRGVEEVLKDPRIAAINVPELMNRRESHGRAVYSRATIPPEDYALMIKEYKEAMVNVVAPRLGRTEFSERTGRILRDYRIPNLVLVGKERRRDALPGPGVVEGLRMLDGARGEDVALGGICIFGRETPASSGYGGRGRLTEPRRVSLKAEAGCDFVTSQITFDPRPALDFLAGYQETCERLGAEPVTVFISIATVPSRGILSLIEGLDVSIPPKTRKRLTASADMGAESVKVATETFARILSGAEDSGADVPLGLQVEQIGTNNDSLSLDLLDSTFRLLM